MKYIAVVATDMVDSVGERFSIEALEEGMPEKGVPLFRNYRTKEVLGHVESAMVEDGKLFVIFDGNDLEALYAVPGFRIVDTHDEEDVIVYDSIKIMAFGLTENPTDESLTKLKCIEEL